MIFASSCNFHAKALLCPIDRCVGKHCRPYLLLQKAFCTHIHSYRIGNKTQNCTHHSMLVNAQFVSGLQGFKTLCF